MVDRLVLVNGLPAAGKTTLATQLAAHLDVPLVSKDSIKELLANAFPAARARGLGPIAMELAWSLVTEMPGTVIMETWWFRPRDLHLVKAGLDRCCAGVVVELWCEVAPETARARFEARRRHAVHDDVRRLAADWTEWATLAEPLGVGLTIPVRTDRPVDVESVAAGLLRVMDQDGF